MPSDRTDDLTENAPNETRRALVLGGTGMLSGCVSALVDAGWNVVLPSRRYAPIPAERSQAEPRPGMAAVAALGRPGHRPTASPAETRQGSGRALWVRADWSQPDVFAAKAGKALGGPADLLVAWVHGGDRETVLLAVAPLLAPGAPVVEVHGSSSAKPSLGCPEPVLADHPTQQVVLGFVLTGDRPRWLNHQEISDGVLTAVHRAIEGRPSAVHQVGEFHSWARR